MQTLSGLTPAPALSPGAPTGTAAQIADRRAFDARVAGRFHQVTYDAVRAQAPGVLILGSRLLVLSTRPEVLEAIAPYVDVITINYYEIAADILALVPNYPTDYGIPFQRMFDDVDAMYRIAGKPILIGEFGYRAADAGLPNTLPPFFPTLATQADRAQALGTYLRRVIARPYLVGAHWFQYMDQPATGRFDGENQNFGLVKITDEAWPEVTERLHAIITRAAPDLSPRTWYGMPAYTKDDKVVCFFKSADKFKSRYATFGFEEAANIDQGAMWPTSFALTKLTPADEKKLGALVKKAVR